MNTELTKVETALTEFSKIEAGLAELRERYAGVVFSVTTPAGMKDALAARAVIRKPRYTAEEIRKAAKAPILELGRSLDAKAKYITAELLKIEEPIQAQIAVEESRKEREVIIENQRVAAITQAITDLHMIVSSMAGKSAAELAKRIADIQEYDLTEWAAEFIPQAEKARAGAVAALQQLHAGAFAQEQAAAAEAKRIADEKADFERRKKELADREKAEADRIEAARIQQEGIERAARAKIEEAERASRARIEEAERQARLAQQARDEVERVKRQAEAERLKAERDKIEAERRAVEDAQRKEREAAEAKAKVERDAKEAAERERQRLANELNDGYEMLATFVRRFGQRDEFKAVCKAIGSYLRATQKAA